VRTLPARRRGGGRGPLATGDGEATERYSPVGHAGGGSWRPVDEEWRVGPFCSAGPERTISGVVWMRVADELGVEAISLRGDGPRNAGLAVGQGAQWPLKVCVALTAPAAITGRGFHGGWHWNGPTETRTLRLVRGGESRRARPTRGRGS